VKTEPAQLIAAARSVDASRVELRILHDKAHATIESSLDGWVGASAAALTASLTGWRSTTDAMTAAMKHHRDALAASAREFRATDAHNADASRAAAQDV
jgi:WXG100 family type VII secretion target